MFRTTQLTENWTVPMRRLGRMISLVATWLSFPAAAKAQVFDAASSFSTINNPTGVWTYGSSLTLGGTLTPYTQYSTQVGGSFQIWGQPTFPGVYHNSSNISPVAYLTGRLGPGDLAAHPGADGEYSIVRFTAPVGGLYALLGSFVGADIFGTTTDVHVLRNGVSLFDGFVNGFGPSSLVAQSQSLVLASGDRVDFAVGFGANRMYFNDVTIVTARLTTVPEPGTWTLLGTGLLAVGGIAERRKRHA